MSYHKPTICALDASIDHAHCTPAPTPQEQCERRGGLYVTEVNGTPTCLLLPQPSNPGENVTGTIQYLCAVSYPIIICGPIGSGGLP